MKKTHIFILVGIAVAIVALIVFGFPSSDFSTYDTISSAKAKQGKYVHLIAKLDKSQPIQYDPIKDPNYLSFSIVDSLGSQTKVIYHNSKPTELEQSERVVLQGKMQGDVFECKSITLKCPSKYKDDKKQLEKTVTSSDAETQAYPAVTNSAYPAKDSTATK
ncbi:cytochrome c maturation protein CcmE [Ferruginibacter sp. SUN106]|uniref:cytochrome c maturation protein CcmE domain-containing protein n=1 Tax=Ferruginibacter sp. SUN106 TaxID=2978348 RepID=UPI003D368719